MDKKRKGKFLITVFTFVTILVFCTAVLAAIWHPSDFQKGQKKPVDLTENTAKLYKMLEMKKIRDGRHLIYTSKQGFKFFRLVKNGKIADLVVNGKVIGLVVLNRAGTQLRPRLIKKEVDESDSGGLEANDDCEWVNIVICNLGADGNDVPGTCEETKFCVPFLNP